MTADWSEKKVLERDIEKHLTQKAKKGQSIAYKFVSPGNNAVPDRIWLEHIPPEHREIVARYIRFAELKRPGGVPTALQLREHERIRALGFRVDVIDSKDGVDAFVKA